MSEAECECNGKMRAGVVGLKKGSHAKHPDPHHPAPTPAPPSCLSLSLSLYRAAALFGLCCGIFIYYILFYFNSFYFFSHTLDYVKADSYVCVCVRECVLFVVWGSLYKQQIVVPTRCYLLIFLLFCYFVLFLYAFINLIHTHTHKCVCVCV